MNDNTREILLIMMEECSEVTQAISKCFRFGTEQVKPNKSRTNIECLEEEIGDLLALVDLLVSSQIGVTHDGLMEAKQRKFEKLKCWSNITVDVVDNG